MLISTLNLIRYRRDYSSGNWTCEEEKFTCGHGSPRCISSAQKCNQYEDCSDGSDETATLCGKYLLYKMCYSQKRGDSMTHLFSDCCSHVLVQYEVDDSIYQVNPYIFTVFEREEGTTNRRDHYKSLDGQWSLDYANCGSWAIKNSTLRSVK